ncbi:hypothetical protein AHiyo4_29920 [Arthrobacter sp. Hiyo4]|nr:hypothetical protein AHiyo4_29920 [Arthrobacter sp. Hiyo4]
MVWVAWSSPVGSSGWTTTSMSAAGYTSRCGGDAAGPAGTAGTGSPMSVEGVGVDGTGAWVVCCTATPVTVGEVPGPARNGRNANAR